MLKHFIMYQHCIKTSIILKLGAYKILWLIIISKNEFIFIQNILIVINLFEILILKLICYNDIKSIIAISLIIHIWD